jgi:hypothetical protein
MAATGDFKKIDISPMFSAGIDCAISSNIRFTAEPAFRYGVINKRCFADGTFMKHKIKCGSLLPDKVMPAVPWIKIRSCLA